MDIQDRFNAINRVVDNLHESAMLNGCIASKVANFYGHDFDLDNASSKRKTIRTFYFECIKKVRQYTFRNNTVATVLKEETFYNIKRSLVVRLNKRVSRDMLRSIALKLKRIEPNTYTRTFIVYYLPGMKVDAEAWASTNFNPNLKVIVFGLSIAQAHTLKRKSLIPGAKVIGTWIDEIAGGKITFFHLKDKLYMEEEFKDGSSMLNEIAAKKAAHGIRFQGKKINDFGEYYLIDKQGNLKLMDENGYIRTAYKIP